MKTAFVLGGGGVLGAHEVGMLRALSEAAITPDLIVGTSVGAINGVFVAADPAGPGLFEDEPRLGNRLFELLHASTSLRAAAMSRRHVAGCPASRRRLRSAAERWRHVPG